MRASSEADNGSTRPYFLRACLHSVLQKFVTFSSHHLDFFNLAVRYVTYDEDLIDLQPIIPHLMF